MADYEQSCSLTKPYYDKTILFLRMIRVTSNKRICIIEYSSGFEKTDTMLLYVSFLFILVPYKSLVQSASHPPLYWRFPFVHYIISTVYYKKKSHY